MACGTYVGYLTHRKRGEKACAPCKAANARRSLIRSRALNLLQKAHPVEFQMLTETVAAELEAEHA